MQLNINVINKVATYNQRDGDIVCGNSDYRVKFTFDSEWDAHEEKTARFIWNGQFQDMDFTGDTCDVPIITGALLVEVGVFAGDLKTTTSATIKCRKSILCQGATPSPENDKHYANEAKEAAERAEEAAHAVTLGSASFRLAVIEENLGLSDPFETFEAVGNGTTAIPDGVKDCAFVEKIYGRYCVTNRHTESYSSHDCNPPVKIALDNGEVIDLSGLSLPHFGDSEHDYIYFEGGKAYYHNGTRWDNSWYFYYTQEEQEAALQEGERVLDTVNDEGALILLAEPIITDISAELDFDGYIDMSGATSVTVESRYNSAEDDPLDIPVDGDFVPFVDYNVGGVILRAEKEKVYADTSATKLGDIDKALDGIMAIQNALLGDTEEVVAVAVADAGGDSV